MKKHWAVSVFILFCIIAIFGTIFVLAADGEHHVGEGGTYNGDFIAAGSSVTNDGTVEGDLIAAAQTISSAGYVDGDIIAAASDISISGETGGSIRACAGNINLASAVGRNAMLFGSNIIVDQNASVKRNAYLFGSVIRVDGVISGNTSVFGERVTLGGKFEGDVTVSNMSSESELNLLPGTVISGKLLYKGTKELYIPNTVKVGSYEFVKINPASQREMRGMKGGSGIRNIIKQILTPVIYYLFALLIYKLFPRFFIKSGNFIAQKPLMAAGTGIATLGSLVGGALLLILVLILTVYIFKGSVFLFAMFAFISVAAITLLFADIPVSLWIGNSFAGRRAGIPVRLAGGLFVITAVRIILDLLKNVQAFAVPAQIISFLVNAFIWVMGTGAVIRCIFDIFSSANKHVQEEEEQEVEPIKF